MVRTQKTGGKFSLFITFIIVKYRGSVVLTFIFLFSYTTNVFGQDTLRYCQSNSPWVSNCYCFYKIEGIFEKFANSDDGQRWYGKGKFTEYKNKIILDSFKIVRTIYHISEDSLLKYPLNDTTNMQSFTLYKKRDELYQKGGKNKRKTIFKKI